MAPNHNPIITIVSDIATTRARTTIRPCITKRSLHRFKITSITTNYRSRRNRFSTDPTWQQAAFTTTSNEL